MEHRRIDVHQHLVPRPYADWLRSRGIAEAGGRELPAWSADDALRVMDAHDIAAAVVSISTPGVHLDPSRVVMCGVRDVDAGEQVLLDGVGVGAEDLGRPLRKLGPAS